MIPAGMVQAAADLQASAERQAQAAQAQEQQARTSRLRAGFSEVSPLRAMLPRHMAQPDLVLASAKLARPQKLAKIVFAGVRTPEQASGLATEVNMCT